MPELGWTIQEWRRAGAAGALERLLQDWVLGAFAADDPAWIQIATPEQIAEQVAALEARAGESEPDLPLYGVPFAVKDNIDAEGFTTTAGCPDFAYVAAEDAEVVARLRRAGAILVGKTNLDQFATGLVGTRSPYGVVPSAFDGSMIGGGSSSGSGSVVARGLVPFALGTDTAGSGRVPAALQNVVGWKPTRGRLSARGVVPACRTLDCVSVFALSVDDAAAVAEVAAGYDARDPYSRRTPSDARAASEPDAKATTPRLAVPERLEFFLDDAAKAAFEATLERARGLGWHVEPIDFTPFASLAALLYTSPWVVERYLVARELLEQKPDALDPVVRGILASSAADSAAAAFEAEYRRAELAQDIDTVLAPFDALIVPTVPTCYSIEEVAADPLGTNARLGTYTNFTNLADLCGLAVPGLFRGDGLPAGITLLSTAFREPRLADLGRALQRELALPLGATGRAFVDGNPTATRDASLAGKAEAANEVTVAVVGAHLRGMALNHQLTQRAARFVEATRTAPRYRLYALPNSEPKKPGLVRVEDGAEILVELWRMPLSRFGELVAEVPAPLGFGKLELVDGRWVSGFICEPCGLSGAEDITSFGGFKAYLAAALN